MPTGSACLHVRRRSYLSINKLYKLYKIRITTERALKDELAPPVDANDKILIERDRPIEFVRAYYRGDLYEHVSELHY